jgi:hypothetical protein
MRVDTSTGVLEIDGLRVPLADLKSMLDLKRCLFQGRQLFSLFIEYGEFRLTESNERHATWFDRVEELREN